MPNSRHTSVMASPSNSRATKRRRSSITELAFHGIYTSRRTKAESVTHVSGTNCHLCLGSLKVGRNRTREQQPVGEAPGDPGESAAAEHGARSVPMPGAAKALQTLGAHSLPNATSARFFKPLGRSGGAEIVKLCRTFCRRHAR